MRENCVKIIIIIFIISLIFNDNLDIKSLSLEGSSETPSVALRGGGQPAKWLGVGPWKWVPKYHLLCSPFILTLVLIIISTFPLVCRCLGWMEVKQNRMTGEWVSEPNRRRSLGLGRTLARPGVAGIILYNILSDASDGSMRFSMLVWMDTREWYTRSFIANSFMWVCCC